MRIISHKKLKEFYETKCCVDSRFALARWYHITEKELIVQPYNINTN
ncbi:MAG: hypothetical protein LBI45_02925 [Bacteroidales bacterium]|nr:hypothetical protein [Bacteroidales bacterium]